MTRVGVVLLLLLTAGCKTGVPPSSKASAKEAEKARTGPGIVLLTEHSQRLAGVVTEALVAEKVADVIHAPGVLTLNEDQTFGVGALVNGRLVSVSAGPGDLVSAGQVLARMHSHEVHDSRASFRKAEEDLDRARTAESYAVRARDRAVRLFDLKASSRNEVDRAEMEVRNAQAAVKNAQVEMERERTHLTEFLEVPARESRSGHAHEGDDIPLRAPAAGTVVARHYPAGAVVSTGQEVFRISNLSSLWLIANVNEAELGGLRSGLPASVSVRAYPDRAFSGRILRLGESLDAATRTLKIRVLVPNTAGLLKPEMFASATFTRNSSRSIVSIPAEAVQELSGVQVVFIQIAPDRFEARPVQTRPASGGRLEVTAGTLSAGDRVVTKGGFAVKSQLLKASLEQEE